MYFPIGWPKVLRNVYNRDTIYKQIISNRDKILFAALTDDSLTLWYCKPTVPIVHHKRNHDSLSRLGINLSVEWKPDSSSICIATSEGHLILYSVEVLTEHNSIYQQYDPPEASLRRDSAELFIKESIPALKLVLFKEVSIWDGTITCMSCISGNEIMISNTNAHLLRYRWDGSQNRDYSIDLRRTPFCINQQVSRAIPLIEDNVYVSDMEYSPLVGGFGITLNDGRAAFLTSSTLKFDPNQVQGIWAPGIDDATCASVNHKYRLIAIGRRNSQVTVFTIDETTGGLELSHTLVLSSKDFPGDPGAVKCMRWTLDSRAVAVSWCGGGISVWSTFGALLMCSLGWDYGINQDITKYNPLVVTSMEWSTEGYQLWMIKTCSEERSSLLQLDFVKSPLTSNPCTSNQKHLYLLADNRIYLNLEDNLTKSSRNNNSYLPLYDNDINDDSSISEFDNINSKCDQPADDSGIMDGKQWAVLPLPSTYIATNWPLRYSAVDPSGINLAVAGRCGFAHYNTLSKRWKLFGNESQEKEFMVWGGMLWWRNYIIVGCFSITNSQYEIRLYPSDNKLDNNFCKTVRMQDQVLSVDVLDDQLVVFCADALVFIYDLVHTETEGVSCTCIQAVDISALCVHPACVTWCQLCALYEQPNSLILNVSGRLMMIQREEADLNDDNNMAYSCLPATVLASCVESSWCGAGRTGSPLSRALWLWCGSHGARVWLPLLSRPTTVGDRHAFMTKRIMLPFQLKIYPLTILFDDAILMGAENDTTRYAADSNSLFALPFCVVHKTNQVYLHQILRQLLRRNLGYHAWEIAESCAQLPYFPHSLELLLHEVLEEEATSKEPIPDAQLPNIIEFVKEFPVYLQTVVQCARKTEIALWDYLFSAAGKPKELFGQCMQRKMLNTAASYLLILQNLESSAVSRQLAIQLLETALQDERWDLAQELVRFLRAIDPNDMDSPRNSMNVHTKYPSITQQSTVSPNAEDLSVILGSVQLQTSRGRSMSTVGETNTLATATATAAVKRKKSVPLTRHDSTGHRNEPDDCGGGAVEARACVERRVVWLWSRGRYRAAWGLAAALGLQPASWLATVTPPEDPVVALHNMHRDFHWPYPPPPHGTSSITAECDSQCGDSGYISLPVYNIPMSNDNESIGCSVAECASIADVAWRVPREEKSTTSRVRGAAGAQLRYVAGVCGAGSGTTGGAAIGALAALLLGDSAAISRLVRAVSHTPQAARAARDTLTSIALWSQRQCLGYKPFMDSISHHIQFLNTIIEANEKRETAKISITTINEVTTDSPLSKHDIRPSVVTVEVAKATRKESPMAPPKNVKNKIKQNEVVHVNSVDSNGCILS